MLARNDPTPAEAALKPYEREPSRPVTLFDAQIALAGQADPGALERTGEALQTWVSVHPLDAEAWQLLTQVWQRLAHPLRALRAEADARLALGDLTGAVDRLRAGQRLARGGGKVDFIEASVIDARLRDVEAQRRQIEKEAAGG